MIRVFKLVAAFAAKVFFAIVLVGNVQAADLGGQIVDEPDAFDPLFAGHRRWYVGIRGGAAFTQDTSFRTLGVNVKNTYKDPAGYIGGMAGYNFGGAGMPGLRGELEVAYMSSSVDTQKLGGTKTGSAGSFGDTSTWLGLASLYSDFGQGGPFRPYIGGGIGFGNVDFKRHGTSANGSLMNNSGTGFAWQVGGGVNIDIAQATELEIGYRYLEVDGIKLTALDGTKSSTDLSNHLVLVGLKFHY